MSKTLDEEGYTPLHKAILDPDDIDKAKKLIEEKADLNAFHDYGRTPLIEAIQFGNLESARLLCESKADIELKSKRKYGMTPLQYAIENRKTEIVSMLLEQRADVNTKSVDGRSAYDILKTNDIWDFARHDLDKIKGEIKQSLDNASGVTLKKFMRAKTRYYWKRLVLKTSTKKRIVKKNIKEQVAKLKDKLLRLHSSLSDDDRKKYKLPEALIKSKEPAVEEVKPEIDEPEQPKRKRSDDESSPPQEEQPTAPADIKNLKAKRRRTAVDVYFAACNIYHKSLQICAGCGSRAQIINDKEYANVKRCHDMLTDEEKEKHKLIPKEKVYDDGTMGMVTGMTMMARSDECVIC